MLKINAIKIDILAVDGRYGCFYTFQSGLNIVRGNNSTGKSSMFQAIIYALGLEELLGGRNEKTMQSVLKDTVVYPDGELHKIIESYVYLEIENNEIVTVKRPIKSEKENSKLIDVYFGALLSGANKSLKKQSMFIHDKGGASDNIFGFHKFLAVFLGWEMPTVTDTRGQETRLYIQQIAPSFIIEQKSGWADFFATMPYYGIKQASSRVVEFVLNMDIFETQKKKQAIKDREDRLREQWKSVFYKIDNIARDTRFLLQGITDKPSNLEVDELCLIKDTNSGIIDIEHELIQIKDEYSLLMTQEIKTVGDNIEMNENQLTYLQNRLNLISCQYDNVTMDLAISEEQLKQYENQLHEIKIDLNKNKNYLKILNLGGQIQSDVAQSICPTCHQPIADSLLPHNVHQEPMRLEDNLRYLEAEKIMVEKFIDGQKRFINEQKSQKNVLHDELSSIRTDIRRIKNDLTECSRMPSVAEIEHRLNLEKKIEFYGRKIEEFFSLKEQISILLSQYINILSEKKQLSYDYSEMDMRKTKLFESYFVKSLRSFNYKSKLIDAIKISSENYLPITRENYNIRFDSSASDFIRCLLAYYISLMQTSIHFKGNHPNLLMLDEPKQQDMSEDDFKVVLKILSEFTQGQIIVFASFSNKDDSFVSDTEGIKFNLIRIEDKLIKRL